MAVPGFRLLILVVLSASFECSLDGPIACPKGKDMRDLLKVAGIAPKHAATYAAILRHNHIDESILHTMTLVQLQNIGIKPLGDRLKIHKYASSDTNDCANGNQCRNGGVCKDGFKCYHCECTEGFYGQTCEKKCDCENNGKCKETLTGFRCECAPGYTGILCEKQWLNEDRFKQLETRLKELTAKLNRTEERLEKSEKEVAKQKRVISEVQTKQNVSGWSMIRVDEDFSKLTKFQLHQKTPTYIQKMPMCLPRNTKAILISVFTNFWNSGGHAYLHFETHQQGNKRNGSVEVNNQHYNIYANTFYYELMLPWDTSLPDELVFVVKGSYQTGGKDNWYKIKLVGYITA